MVILGMTNQSFWARYQARCLKSFSQSILFILVGATALANNHRPSAQLTSLQKAGSSSIASANPSAELTHALGISLYDLSKSVSTQNETRKKLAASITPNDETEAFTRLQNQLRERDDICAVPGAKRLDCNKDMSKERESIHLLLSARQRYIEKNSSAIDSAGISYLWIVYVAETKADRLVFEPWIKRWTARCQNEKMRLDPDCRNEKIHYGKSIDDFMALTMAFAIATKKGQKTIPGIEKAYEVYRD